MQDSLDLTTIFYWVDEFCTRVVPIWEQQRRLSGDMQRLRSGSMTASEVITLLILFHLSGYRTLKHFYEKHVIVYLSNDFPLLVSYSRFVELQGKYSSLLFAFAQACCSTCDGISFIDSTILKVCRNQRIHSHKVFAQLAARGKSSMGWFYGFKLHLVINTAGEYTSFFLTGGNTADCNQEVLGHLSESLWGKLFGDKGYLSKKLSHFLKKKQNVQLLTKLRSNMKNMLVTSQDKYFLHKRGVIEAVNNILKSTCQIEHTRHRSPQNFLSNLFSGLIAYQFLPTKPSINSKYIKLSA